MKFLAVLISTVAVAASAVVAAPANEVVEFNHPLTKRGVSPSGAHMVDLAIDQRLFDTLIGAVFDIVPANLNALKFEDVTGTLPGTGLTGRVNYTLSDMKVQGVKMNQKTGFKLNDGSITVSTGLDATFTANYHIVGRVGFGTKSTSGQMVVTVGGAFAEGQLVLGKNGIGGLQIAMKGTKTSVQNFNVKLADAWWARIVSSLTTAVAKPIVTTAMGTVLNVAIPPLVNVLFENQLSVGLTLPNGERMSFHAELADTPVVTKQNVLIGMNLVRTKL